MKEALLKYLKENFQPSDNIKRDFDGERAMLNAEYRHLGIELMIKDLPSLVNPIQTSKGWINIPLIKSIELNIKLGHVEVQSEYKILEDKENKENKDKENKDKDKKTITKHERLSFNDVKIRNRFHSIMIYTGNNIPAPDIWGQSGRVRFALDDKLVAQAKNNKVNFTSDVNDLPEFKRFVASYTQSFIVRLANYKDQYETVLKKYNVIDLCIDALKKKLGNQRFNSMLKNAIAKAKVDVIWEHHQDKNNLFDIMKENNPYEEQADIVDEMIIRNPQDISIKFTKNLDKLYSDIHQGISSFSKPETKSNDSFFSDDVKEQDCNIIFKVAKTFNYKTYKKLLYPVSKYKSKYISDRCYYLPLMNEEQILLRASNKTLEKDDIVVLTDSVELATQNQQETPDGVHWFSFWTLNDKYSEIDFSPLKDVREVYLLVTNHSGFSLAEAYRKISTLAIHLSEQYKISCKFVQVAVNYQDIERFENVADIIKYYTDHKPEVVKKSIMCFDEYEDFKIMHDKAVEPQKPFWSSGSEEVVSMADTTDIEDNKLIDYLLRPLVPRNKITLIHALRGRSKSFFALFLAVSIVNGKNIIKGKAFSVPKNGKTKAERDADNKKVMILDWENGTNSILLRKIDYVDPYLKGETYEHNLKIKEMDDEKNYSDLVNHQEILDMINKFEDKYGKLDLIVFDTYKKLIKKEDEVHQNNAHELFQKIIKRNTAVLIIDHSNSFGRTRGGSWKEDTPRVIMQIERDELDSLNDPTLVTITKNNDGNDVEKMPFVFHVNDSNKQVEVIDQINELKTKDLENIDFIANVMAYKAQGAPYNDLYNYMDKQHSAFDSTMKGHKDLYDYIHVKRNSKPDVTSIQEIYGISNSAISPVTAKGIIKKYEEIAKA